MECFTTTVSYDIFMDNYFTFFRLCLPNFDLTTFEQNVCSTKTTYGNALSLGINSCKKRERGHFEQSTSSKKAV